MSYTADRHWSDQFIPTIRKLVGPYLLVPSSLDVDRTQAADLVVLRGRDMTIAARVRRRGYFNRYPTQITIRSARDSGARTELGKLLEGWGDWLFYGHAGSCHGAIDQWMLVDLHLLRRDLLRCGYRQGWGALCDTYHNGDGTHFVALDMRRFGDDVVISTNIGQLREAA